MFLLVPAYPGCPGSKAVKQSLLLLLLVSACTCLYICACVWVEAFPTIWLSTSSCCAVVGNLKPADQLVNPEAAVAAAPAAGNHAPVPLGTASHNCGLAKDCLAGEFAVHLFTGKENLEGPRICINGH